MLDIFLFSVFEGSFSDILSNLGKIVGIVAVLYIVAAIILNWKEKDLEFTNLYEDYKEWKADLYWTFGNNKLSELIKYTIEKKAYLDILTCGLMFLYSLLFFYIGQWIVNLTLFFTSFDEIGALNFVLRWMPDNLFFNLIRNIFYLWDLVISLLMLFTILLLCEFELTYLRRGFLIQTIFKIVFLFYTAVLYIDEVGEWYCNMFDPNEYIVYLIDNCSFGFMLSDNIRYYYPIAAIASLIWYCRAR